MAKGYRSEHLRVSVNGNVHTVRAHTFQRSGLYAGLLSSSATRCSDVDANVTRPTSCPVCGARVFFFASEDGGRVFFDALGHPWPKHPCTLPQPSFPSPTGGSRPIPGATPFDFGAKRALVAMRGRFAFIRYGDDEQDSAWYRGPLDPLLRFHPGAFVTRHGKERITFDFVRRDTGNIVSVQAKPSSGPGPYNEASWAEVSNAMLARLRALVAALGLRDVKLGRVPLVGPVGCAMAGRSRLFMIPFGFDDFDPDDTDARDIVYARMGRIAARVREAFAEAEAFPENPLFEDVLLFCVEDRTGAFHDGIVPSGFPIDLDEIGSEAKVDGLSDDFGSCHWIDITAGASPVTEIARSVGRAVDRDASFVESLDRTGRAPHWRLGELACTKRGVNGIYRLLKEELARYGWRLDQRSAWDRGSLDFLEAVTSRNALKLPRSQAIRLLPRFSDKTRGLACLLHSPDNKALLEEHIIYLARREEISRFVSGVVSNKRPR